MNPAAAFDRSAYKWRVVAMLWFVCFFNYADRQAIFSVFPLLQSQLHVTDIQLGIAGSSFMWVYAIFGPVAGWLGDRFSRQKLILGGLIFWSLATAATALCHQYWQLVLCRALGGFGEAFYFPASMALISDYHAADTRSRAMSVHQSGVYAGTVAGAAAAGYLAQHYGWRFAFVLFGGAGILLGLFLFGFLREPVSGQSEQTMENPDVGSANRRYLRTALEEILKNRAVITLIVVFMGANFVATVFLTWAPSFLYRRFAMSLSMAGWNAAAYLQMAAVAGVISGGVLADRLARKRRSGRMLAQTVGLVAGAPFLFLTGIGASAASVIVAMTLFGYCKGIYDSNIFASLYDVIPAARRAIAAGVLNSLGWIGGSLAPIAIAAGAQRFGMGACISATSAIYLMAAGLLISAARQSARIDSSNRRNIVSTRSAAHESH